MTAFETKMKKFGKSTLKLTGLLAASLFTCQCSAPGHSGEPITLIGALDASASNRNDLPASLMGMAELASSLPPGSHTTLYRIDVRCQEIYNADAPKFTEDFAAHMTSRLNEVAHEDNTYLHLLARSITSGLKSSRGKVVVVIDTDYFGEGMTTKDHQEVASCANSWAKDERVLGIVVCHVNPKCMESARADFAGANTKAIITPDGAPTESIMRMITEGSK